MIVIVIIPSVAELCFISKGLWLKRCPGVQLDTATLETSTGLVLWKRPPRCSHSQFCSQAGGAYLFPLLPFGIVLLSASGWVRLPFHPPEVRPEIAIPEMWGRSGSVGGKGNLRV